MTTASRGFPAFLLLLYCLSGTTWSLTLSKETVKETSIRKIRDTLYVRNAGSQPLRVEALAIVADRNAPSAWELAFRAGRAGNEICVARGTAGACPPLPPAGRLDVPWVIPAGDSLALFDFRLEPCIRCPLGQAALAAGEDSLSVAMTLLGGGSRATFRLEARLGRPAARPRAGPGAGAPPPVDGGSAPDTQGGR